MCSNCSGSYENPDMTQWPDDRESTEQEVAAAIEQEHGITRGLCDICQKITEVKIIGGNTICSQEVAESEWEQGKLYTDPTFVSPFQQRLEQEQILEASRSVRAGVDMLFAAMRKARVL